MKNGKCCRKTGSNKTETEEEHHQNHCLESLALVSRGINVLPFNFCYCKVLGLVLLSYITSYIVMNILLYSFTVRKH